MARTTKNTKVTKVTKNTKSVKENKTMAKQANITLNLTGTVEELNALAEYMKEQGIKAEKQGKATEVGKKATGKTTKKSTKAPSNFDRERYESIGEQLGVLGKHGVHKFARETVYEAMKEEELTEEILDKYEQKIIEIATKKNLTWFLEKQGAEVEIEDDEEVAI